MEDAHFDEHIFQMGWFNHQPVMVWLVSLTTFRGRWAWGGWTEFFIPRSGGLTKAPWRHEGTLKTVLTRVDQGGDSDRIWWGESLKDDFFSFELTAIEYARKTLVVLFLDYIYMVTFCHMHHASHPKSFMLSTWIHFPYHPCMVDLPHISQISTKCR